MTKKICDICGKEMPLHSRSTKHDNFCISSNGKVFDICIECRNLLDNIVVKIADLDDTNYDYERYYKAIIDAIEIINKYKAESENKYDRCRV